MGKLIYDFINKDHTRMHCALIQAGWYCNNDVKLSEINCFKYNWRYSKDNLIIYFDNSWDKIGCNYDMNKCYYLLDNKTFSEVADIIETELKQPNKIPDQPAETHEEIEDTGLSWRQGIDNSTTWKSEVYQKQFPQVTVEEKKQEEDMQEHYPTTKHNIVKVLEYNNIYTSTYSGIDYLILNEGEECELRVHINHPNLIQTIEAHYGRKLNPIPKPKFDFVQYLLDNGFTKHKNYNGLILKSINGLEIKYSDRDGIWMFAGVVFQPILENAKTLVEMAKQGEKLI